MDVFLEEWSQVVAIEILYAIMCSSELNEFVVLPGGRVIVRRGVEVWEMKLVGFLVSSFYVAAIVHDDEMILYFLSSCNVARL